MAWETKANTSKGAIAFKPPTNNFPKILKPVRSGAKMPNMTPITTPIPIFLIRLTLTHKLYIFFIRYILTKVTCFL
ncbi:hypothetical protein KUN4944_02500 [Streptococcus pyogenes]|nr:hypothetical protein KUN4944_02500 [Streptococcus pyogenes]